MATYSRNSPYFSTPMYGSFLDLMVPRKVDANADDTLYAIEKVYEYRPDLLANDIYDDAGLWWVFQARNPNVITDPLGDFTAGKKIYVPQKKNILMSLGL
jgi:hypothetical protein